jgi:Protein of unknown function (DUF3417)
LSDPNAITIWPKIEGIDALAELALNLHWSWSHATDELWQCLDSRLWKATQNPWVILRTVSKDKIKSLSWAQNTLAPLVIAWLRFHHHAEPCRLNPLIYSYLKVSLLIAA